MDDGIIIKTMHGVIQGCCLSPTLFIITMKLLIDQLGIQAVYVVNMSMICK